MKKHKRRIKKQNCLIFLGVIIALIVFIKWDRSYDINYKVNNINVQEIYNKKEKKIYIKINYEKKDYEFVLNKVKGKKLVEKIDYFKHDKNYCLNIKVEELKTNPLCYKDKQLTTYYLIDDQEIKNHFHIKEHSVKLKEIKEDIKIYDYMNYNYLIWDYRNFQALNNKETKKIKITDSDNYDIKLTAKINEYLLIADYNTKYDFSKFYIINMKTFKKETWNIDYNISKESYILGTYKDSIYLVDKKNKIEYEIVPSHKKIRIVGTNSKKGTIYNDGFKDISLKSLASKENKFTKDTVYNFKVINNKLYESYLDSKNNILIDDNKNIKIIDFIDNTVFYLLKDELYLYNDESGKVLLMQKFEWNFNSDNIFFIYK